MIQASNFISAAFLTRFSGFRVPLSVADYSPIILSILIKKKTSLISTWLFLPITGFDAGLASCVLSRFSSHPD